MGSQMRMKPASNKISEIYRGVSDLCASSHAETDARLDRVMPYPPRTPFRNRFHSRRQLGGHRRPLGQRRISLGGSGWISGGVWPGTVVGE